MKKVFFLLLITCLVVFFIIPKTEEIRIRIISNSSSEIDIDYKDEIVEYFKEKVVPYIELTDEYLKENYKKIEALLKEKFDDIFVEYENHTFKNKTYNNSVIADGTFKTLLILVKDAEGPNWWGSIFDGAIVKEGTDEVVYEWYFKKIIR